MYAPPTLSELKDEAALKNYIAESRSTPDLRSRWGHDADLWKGIVQVLKDVDSTGTTPLNLLRFLNNITASPGTGQYACAAEFPLTFSRVNIENGVGAERRLYWQILANFVSSFTNEQTEVLENAIEQISSKLPLSQTITNDVDDITYPCLIFMMVTNGKLRTESVKWALNVRTHFIDALLDVLPAWLEAGEEKDRQIGLSRDIFSMLITNGPFLRLLRDFQHNPSRLLMLLSMFDAVITSPTGERGFLDTETGESTLTALVQLLEKSMEHVEKLINTEERTEEESFVSGQCLLKLLDIMVTILTRAPPQKRRTLDILVPKLVQLLIVSKKIPPISKLGDSRSFEDVSPDDRAFPHLRTHILMLLAVLAENNWQIQEQIRKIGGLAAILECCVIDMNNPFMKERAIVCLRYLLYNNAENQNFVASLEARQVADPDALAQAGYEATIKDGKLVLKSA